MDLRLSGHVAAVVGSAQGIGAAIARAFAANAMLLAILGNSAAALLKKP